LSFQEGEVARKAGGVGKTDRETARLGRKGNGPITTYRKGRTLLVGKPKMNVPCTKRSFTEREGLKVRGRKRESGRKEFTQSSHFS